MRNTGKKTISTSTRGLVDPKRQPRFNINFLSFMAIHGAIRLALIDPDYAKDVLTSMEQIFDKWAKKNFKMNKSSEAKENNLLWEFVTLCAKADTLSNPCRKEIMKELKVA